VSAATKAGSYFTAMRMYVNASAGRKVVQKYFYSYAVHPCFLEASGQLDAPAALSPVKEHKLSIG
jgi:hypothetical protein